MYCILMDTKTKSFYMQPDQIRFYAYTSPDKYEEDIVSAILVETETDDYYEFMTYLYNNGFIYGYLDGELVHIKKGDVVYCKQNSNELIFAQHLLTKNDDYLKYIKKQGLFTLCNLSEDKKSVLFPTVIIDDGTVAVLTYTDATRIPTEMREKYDGWRMVNMTFDVVCIVNGKFVAI